jgi:hypothetical protein
MDENDPDVMEVLPELPGQRRDRSPSPDSENHESDPEDQPAHIRRPIPDPPVGGEPRETVKEVMDELNEFAKANGFGVSLARASNYKDGQPTRWEVHCDRGVRVKSQGTGKRDKKYRRINCPWKGVLNAYQANDGMWTFRLHDKPEYQTHSHGQSLDPSAHSIHRQFSEEQKHLIEDTSRIPGLRAQQVQGLILDKDPSAVFNKKDINNYRRTIRLRDLDGYTPVQALVKILVDEGIQHAVRYDPEDPDRLTGIIWTFDCCVEMWKRYSEVLSFDNTYSTNCLGLPLFVITGVSNINSVFNVAFGLVNSEQREEFTWCHSASLWMTSILMLLAKERSYLESTRRE